MRPRLSRALPAILRAGWKDALAYRAELVVWMLTMTLPLIMLSLFRSVAQDSPDHTFGGFDAAGFTAYFLAGLVVRQVCSSWSVYIINAEIRDGTLGMRLLRPVHPLWTYFGNAVAQVPQRALLSVPLALGLLYALHGDAGRTLARSPALLSLFVASVAFAYALAFCISAAVGVLGLYFESSLGLWSMYLGLHGLFSGYLVPLPLLPHIIQRIAWVTPFPYLQAVPLEILLGHYPPLVALRLLAQQAAWLATAFTVLLFAWRRGEKRFAAYGG